MLEPWNDASILPPPVNTAPTTNYIISVKLKQVLNNITAALSQQSPLHKESALLSRFLYKYDKKFRNDIGYRNLKKVGTALRKYLWLNLLKDVEYLNSNIPEEEADLPTKQMLQYILVRLMTFSKIMLRIYVCSKQSAVFYLDRVKRGENHWMSLMPYALMSRVWSAGLVLLEYTIKWYNQLHTFLDNLSIRGANFLPIGYELPDDLSTWLDFNNIDNCGRFEWSSKIEIDSNLTENYDEDMSNILDYVKELNGDPEDFSQSNLSISEPIMVETNVQTQNFDKGESISREHFKSFFSNQPPNKKLQSHLAENVTSKSSLQEFLKKEELFRNSCDNNNSLTKHLSFMQWQTLKRALDNLCDSLANNRKIERKFKKIWQDKCIDYLQ